MTTNGEWLDYLAQNAPDELAAWFDAEHVENQERALDGDTDALERKSADLIHEYYKPMVAELQAKVDELTAERDQLKNAINELQKKQPYCYNPEQPLDTLNTIGRYIDELTAERDELKFDISLVRKNRDKYRSKFGKCLDYADAIHALMDDEGVA